MNLETIMDQDRERFARDMQAHLDALRERLVRACQAAGLGS